MLNHVMEDESAIPFLEDEAIEFECLLIVPQDHHISVDGFLCFHRNSPEKHTQMEYVHCKFGRTFGIKLEEEQLLGQEVLDMTPSDNEFGEFQAPNALFTCEDYLLDVESGESIAKLDYHLGKGSENLVLENRREPNKAGYSGTPQESELYGATNWLQDFQGDLHMNDYKSSGIFSSSPDKEIAIEDRWFKYPTPFPIESIEQLEDVSSMFSENEKNIILSPGLSSSEEMFRPSISNQQNEYGSVAQSAEGGSNLEQDVSWFPSQGVSVCAPAGKRLRKPPHRFIDELPDRNSKNIKRKISTPAPKGKSSKAKRHKHDFVKSTAERSLSEEPAAIAIQVPFGPLACEESEKKQVFVAPKVLHSKPIAPVAISEEDCVSNQKKQMCVAPKVSRSKPIASLAISEEDFVSSRKKQMPVTPKAIDSKPVASVITSEEDCVSVVKHGEDSRRKHHILWTVSEVKKLIDGVSQHGVGKWSHIKKDLFSSSAHRTAVDLKDKWRNLLKATCVQNEGKRGLGDKKRNLAWRPLPKSIARRVRELAVMYPYPRDFQTKH